MRRSSNLRRLLIAMLAVVSVATAACGSSGPDAQSQERKPGEKVTLTFWSWVPGVDKAVDLWNSKNPEVQVKLEKIPAGGNGGYAKMHSALKTGQAPDLGQVEYQVIPEFLLDDGLVDLKALGIDERKGDGVAHYLGTRPDPATMGVLLRRAAEAAGVTPVVPGAPAGVEATVRRGQDGARYLFLLNHNKFDVSVPVPSGARDLLAGAPLGSQVEVGGRGVVIARLGDE